MKGRNEAYERRGTGGSPGTRLKANSGLQVDALNLDTWLILRPRRCDGFDFLAAPINVKITSKSVQEAGRTFLVLTCLNDHTTAGEFHSELDRWKPAIQIRLPRVIDRNSKVHLPTRKELNATVE